MLSVLIVVHKLPSWTQTDSWGQNSELGQCVTGLVQGLRLGFGLEYAGFGTRILQLRDICIHTYIHTCIHAYMIYPPTHIHTYIHICMHTYQHIHTLGMRGKAVSCDGSAGCRIVSDIYPYDSRYQGPMAASVRVRLYVCVCVYIYIYGCEG